MYASISGGNMMKGLSNILVDYKKELELINKELEVYPIGRLVKKKKYYYHASGEKEFSITNDRPLIQSLSRKKYLLEMKKRLEQNILVLSQTNKLSDLTPENLIKAFPASYQDLPKSYFYHPSVESFLSKELPKNSYNVESLHYHSNNGIALRSKSEMIIANELEAYNIPYQYEAPLRFLEHTKYPDFTIKNPFNGKVFIWEHFGGLHLKDYEDNMTNKMMLYTKHGYRPFETIIYTFEFDIKNINRIRALIEGIIL